MASWPRPMSFIAAPRSGPRKAKSRRPTTASSCWQTTSTNSDGRKASVSQPQPPAAGHWRGRGSQGLPRPGQDCCRRRGGTGKIDQRQLPASGRRSRHGMASCAPPRRDGAGPACGGVGITALGLVRGPRRLQYLSRGNAPAGSRVRQSWAPVYLARTATGRISGGRGRASCASSSFMGPGRCCLSCGTGRRRYWPGQTGGRSARM